MRNVADYLIPPMARHKPGKGAAAGLVGGLVGTVVMTEFQEAWSKASKALKRDGQQSQQQPSAEQSEDATMRAAGKIAVLGGRQLSHAEKAKFAPLVHYSFGTLSGAAYGLAMEKAGVKGGFIPGLIFGAALFALADEIAVPALKLSGKASETPLSGHISAFAAHLVYGVSTELARRGLRAAI